MGGGAGPWDALSSALHHRPAGAQSGGCGWLWWPAPGFHVQYRTLGADVIGAHYLQRVFQRYPKLQIGSVENELSWAPNFLDRLDYTYTQRTIREGWWDRFTGDKLPSEYFHSNVFMGFQEDGLGIRLRDVIGVDNLMWGSDYPHAESTFPRSRQILEEILEGCTEEEKAKIAGGNVARVYNLD